MTTMKYVKMNYAELEKEIQRQKKTIESAKEKIALCEKLQIAENVKSQNEKPSTS